ncbi:MAG: aromatic ring-hydroxylating dioxygenase subunit alpha [Acidimicrobiia bacterium]|nr:aromatic ring-hydroxylating dioxygenase subunit alpha [Acidimicrobiia bacterium]
MSTGSPASAAAPIDGAALAPVLDPAGSGSMLPAAAYLDADVLAWERTHLFAGAWVCVGRSAELRDRGMRRAVRVGDDAVLLVRGNDGRLRGFYNTCRHRAHELAPCGTVSQHPSIHCPYHGWRYGLDGALRATPRFDAPVGFDRADHGLVAVAVEEWHGWVMVNADGTAAPRAEFLAGLEPRVDGYEPQRLIVGATHSYEVAANWKLIVENYHECFHCPNIHPQLCAVSAPTSSENAAGHDGFWVGGWLDLTVSAATMSLDGRSPTTPLPGLHGPALRRVDYVGLLPNLLVSLHPDYVMTHRLEPLAPDRTAVECQWLFDPGHVARDDFDPSFAVDFWDLTNRQDWAACEGVQRGIGSRGYRQGPFSRVEDAVAQFTRLVATAYRSGGWGRPDGPAHPRRDGERR